MQASRERQRERQRETQRETQRVVETEKVHCMMNQVGFFLCERAYEMLLIKLIVLWWHKFIDISGTQKQPPTKGHAPTPPFFSEILLFQGCFPGNSLLCHSPRHPKWIWPQDSQNLIGSPEKPNKNTYVHTFLHSHLHLRFCFRYYARTVQFFKFPKPLSLLKFTYATADNLSIDVDYSSRIVDIIEKENQRPHHEKWT